MPTPAARRDRSAAILVVEQDAGIADPVRDILQDEGYAVAVAQSDDAALAAAARHPPDLVVLELRLPVREAPAFLRELRDLPACADLPVLAVSTSPNVEGLPVALGVQGALAKPFELEDLLAAVKRLARPPTPG